MAAMQAHWDIFCRVVDNYGDIGVCWRLARQLAAEHGLRVRLWVDAPDALARLAPDFDPGLAAQSLAGVEVRRWPEPFPETTTADVVIESFACELPAPYLQAMARRDRKPCWINLEYLSAEPWVEGCHGMASPHPTLPLVKHFFFPGFTAGTGGLLRESGLPPGSGSPSSPWHGERALEVSLFCYDPAPVGELIDAWVDADRPVRCRVPPGKPLAAVTRRLGRELPWRCGQVAIEAIPFLPQDDYDHLLRACDLNFVRGEDSFVRAQWAARPFVWQIYPQQDDAHLDKLEAFLAHHVKTLPPAAAIAVRELFHAWNTEKNVAAAWQTYLEHYPTLVEHAHRWAEGLASRDGLAKTLVAFCASRI